MSFKSNLNLLNRCFIIFGGGSIKYNGRKWIFANHFWRFILICLNVLLMNTGNKRVGNTVTINCYLSSYKLIKTYFYNDGIAVMY